MVARDLHQWPDGAGVDCDDGGHRPPGLPAWDAAADRVASNTGQALETGYQAAESPISVALAEALLSKQMDDPEAMLTRQGYRVHDLVAQFHVKPAGIRALFNNQVRRLPQPRFHAPTGRRTLNRTLVRCGANGGPDHPRRLAAVLSVIAKPTPGKLDSV